MIWVIRKIRHMIESLKMSTIIFINHNTSVKIIKQTALTFSFTDKMNLKLVCVSEYLQCFDLDVRYKLRKLHIVSNALLRLTSANKLTINFITKLDALHIWVDKLIDSYDYTATLIEMILAFRIKLINSYSINSVYVKILAILDDNKKLSHENAVKIWFERESDDLIWHLNKTQHHQLCVSKNVIKDILEVAHENEMHSEYNKFYEEVAAS